MKIAVNTKLLHHAYPEDDSKVFLYETFKRIVQKNPGHEFIFIFDQPYAREFIFADNIMPVVTGPVAKSPLSWKLWYDIKIPAVLKKYKADIFISCDGLCSLTAKGPQVILLDNLTFIDYPSIIKKSLLFFYKQLTPKFLEKAKAVVTVSDFLKQKITTQYAINTDKVEVIQGAAREIFQPVSNEKKEIIKTKYTDGKEYFLYAGPIGPQSNLINLLKAFSVFKKRQRSNLKLLLAGKAEKKYTSFTQSLKTYKYRDDVVLIENVSTDELVAITGAAYAFIYPSMAEAFAIPVLEAMQCGVPVIVPVNSSMPELTQGVALYIDANDYNDIAEKMMRLYKDENLRNEHIEKGMEVAAEYSWDKTADLFWQSILKTIPDSKLAIR
jgi:glycosyltransferase involved in cell wall biosynthesis